MSWSAIKAQTDKPFNVNFFCHAPPDAERRSAKRVANGAGAVLRTSSASMPRHRRRTGTRAVQRTKRPTCWSEFKPAVVSFHFGLPRPSCSRACEAWGAKILSSATTVEEARWLEAHGVDAIIAQGLEAGGHRGNFLSDDLTHPARHVRAAAADRAGREAAGDRCRRHRRRRRRCGGDGAGRGRRADRHRLPAVPRSDDQRGAPRGAQERAPRHTALTNLFTGRPARGIVNRVMRELGPDQRRSAGLSAGHRRHCAAACQGGRRRARATSRRFGRARMPADARRSRPRNSRANWPPVCSLVLFLRMEVAERPAPVTRL